MAELKITFWKINIFFSYFPASSLIHFPSWHHFMCTRCLCDCIIKRWWCVRASPLLCIYAIHITCFSYFVFSPFFFFSKCIYVCFILSLIRKLRYFLLVLFICPLPRAMYWPIARNEDLKDICCTLIQFSLFRLLSLWKCWQKKTNKNTHSPGIISKQSL